MLKWEYYIRFIDRFKKFTILNNMKLYTSIIFYVISKLLQGMAVFGLTKIFINIKYASLMIVGIIILNWILEIRESEGKIITLIQQEHINLFYKIHTDFSDRKISLGLVVSEVLWNSSDIIGIYLPLFFALFNISNGILISLTLTAIAVAFLYAVEAIFLYLTYCRVIQRKKKNNIPVIVLKLLVFCASVWLGSCISDFILSCPLSVKSDGMMEIKKWLKTWENIKISFNIKHLVMLVILVFLLTIAFLLCKLIDKYNLNSSREYYHLYSLSRINEQDFGLFSLIICGICSGALYNKGCGHSNISCLIGILLAIYTIPYIMDDIFSLHDELSLDNDKKRIYLWKERIEALLIYKLKIFVTCYLSKLVLFYIIVYIFTFNNVLDLLYVLNNILLICCMLVIGFLEKNRAIVNSPQKIKVGYEQIKYNKERIMERDIIGGQILCIGILVSIPAILLACGDISSNLYWVLQGTIIISLLILINYLFVKLCIQMRSDDWLVKLFDEE